MATKNKNVRSNRKKGIQSGFPRKILKWFNQFSFIKRFTIIGTTIGAIAFLIFRVENGIIIYPINTVQKSEKIINAFGDCQAELGELSHKAKCVDGYTEKQIKEAAKIVKENSKEINDLAIAEFILGNYKEAIKYWEINNDAESPVYQLFIGKCYLNGIPSEGIEKDIPKGLKWLKMAGNNENEIAIFTLMNYFYDKRQPQKGFFWAEKGAELGFENCQKKVGLAYMYEDGTIKDENKGLFWFNRAIEEHNSVEPMVWVGEIYYFGFGGIKKDYSEAFKYMSRAAELNNPDAMAYLGEFFYNGEVVPKNYTASFEWLKRAADFGNPRAQYYLSQFYSIGLGNIEIDNRKAQELVVKSAKRNFPKAKEFCELNGIKY